MWLKKKNSGRNNNLSMKEFFISVSLAVFVYALNLFLVWLMNKDAVAITCLLFISFIISASWRLSGHEDREGWHYIILPLSDFATVIFALACVSTIADADFKPAIMQPVIKFLAGGVCGVYGFTLCREILSIGYEKTIRK